MITEIEIDEDIYREKIDIGASSVRVYGNIDDINRVADYARHMYDPTTIKESLDSDNNENDVDMVNHPSHYEHGIECIDEMILLYGKEETMSFCKLNSHKYRKRAFDKGGKEDIDKSDWYIKKYAYLNSKSEFKLKEEIYKKYNLNNN